MAKLTFPPFPISLKNWTPKDRQLNHFAIRSFRDVADADYIAARLAYRAQLLEVSFVVWWHWIISLDRAVWELRRFCTSEPRPRSLKLVDGEIAPRYRVDSGYLEKVLDDKQNPAREYLLWHNGFFGKSKRKVTVRGTFIAVNSPLFNQPDLVDQLAGLAFIPKDVAAAYRELAAERKKKRCHFRAHRLRVRGGRQRRRAAARECPGSPATDHSPRMIFISRRAST